MTATVTTTQKPLTIPAAGLRHEANGTVVTARYVSAAGYKVEVRIGGEYQPQLSSLHTFEGGSNGALDAYNARVAEAESIEAGQPVSVAVSVEAPTPAVKLPAAAKGTQTKISDPGHTALAIAALVGHVERGGKPGQAPIGVLNALAKRGHLELTYQTGRSDARKVVTGGVITNAGRAALARLTADERADAEKAARLAVIDRIQIAA